MMPEKGCVPINQFLNFCENRFLFFPVYATFLLLVSSLIKLLKFLKMKLTVVLIILSLAFTTLSCNDEDDFPTEKKVIELDEKSTQLVQAGNEFGFELFRNIYEQETENDNIMVSPLSVSLALAMVYNGANGETKTAMEKTLKMYGLTPDEINQSYSNLVAELQSLDPRVLLEIANAIFYRKDFEVENKFISTNQNYYNAKVDALDFNSPNAVKTINNWVADKTNDKIKTILQSISSEQVMFLLNAIYFKGIWQNKFDEDDTEDLPFYTDSDHTVDVPTMKKTDDVRFAANDLFSAVELPYGTGNYCMYFFLPRENNSVDDVVAQLDKNNWTNWMNEFGNAVKVDLEIPRLKYGYEIKLNDVLSDMGMGVAFGSGADFTGINKNEKLFIDYVKHKTFIEVNEKGTEAAAVTVVAVGVTSVGPVQNIQFKLNRPFLFAITETETGAILFMGTVKNPK